MTPPNPRPPFFRRCFKKLSVYSKRLFIIAFFVFLSTLTPIFATVVGGILSVVGDWYGQDRHSKSAHTPQAFIILGGGLTKYKENGKSLIILNNYSYNRTQTLWQTWQKTPLPIIASGVESPWIKNLFIYLQSQHQKISNSVNSQTDNPTNTPQEITKNNPQNQEITPIVITENASMNTCENARFSAKIIHHESTKGTLPTIHHVYLVSDWYHMARARRQFAKAGIFTTPLIAPMPKPMSWRDISSNRNHARRAFYESIALLRDIIRPQNNCRSADEVSIKLLETSRRNPKTF